MNPALAVEALRVMRGQTLAVCEVTLAVPAQTWFGLIGANGSGKTSVLRAVAGRLAAQGGQIRIGGVDMSADRAARARAIGFAPDPAMLPDALTAREILSIAGGALEPALATLGSLAAALEIERLIETRIGACSAGMRQRIAIACAFARPTDIVILDEPFNWLDPLAAYDLRRALRARVDDGLTLVTALHDLTTLAGSCDSGALLAEGCVAFEIDADAILAARSDPLAFERTTIEHLRTKREG
ncbi:ATP-binding cassette domain-containing protein [Sphingomonas sp. LT1P40]|uniref:ATP-binding cassette domain-containing protein n=1 Tax=Alteristakelama amylovorans TaxID=3096166 RepID=UPI002FC816E9